MTVAAKPLSPQCRQVLEYMSHHAITSRESWRYLGISRLGARIWELRHEHGYGIDSKMIPVPDRNGELRWVKRYWLTRNGL